MRPAAVSLAGFLGSDERHEEHQDDYLDDPTDDANSNRPKCAAIIQSLPNRDDHGDQHPDARDQKDDTCEPRDETENPNQAGRT